MANLVTEIWERLTSKQPNRFDEYVMKMFAANAIYPGANEELYQDTYTGNNDFFTIINKIVEPASTVPIFQYHEDGTINENGKMIARLNKPNGYQSRAQFLESALSFFLIFGESYTVEETLDNGLNAGIPARLDQLPPRWVQVNLGTYFNPVAGYSFYPFTSATKIDYEKDKVFHWKEFNPDYDIAGGHLKGMSRIKPLIKSIVGSTEAYNSLVKAFQSQGMWGILTMLGEDGESVKTNKVQKSMLKNRFRTDSKKGDVTISDSKVEYTKMGLTIVELEVLKALGMFKGNLCDAYNFPDILLSGSQSKTYSNYKEGERALWTNAICPNVDAYIEGLSNFLAPKFGEAGDVLKADYSGVEALQKNVGELITWMIAARSFTKNEIREAAGYEMLPDPAMDMIFESAGLMPLAELSAPPDELVVESAMKALKISDYRK